MPRGLRVLEAEGTAESGLLLSPGGIAASPIAVRLRYQPTPEGRLRLVWEMEIEPENRPHWWRVRVDAASGELLARADLLDGATTRSLRGPAEPTRHLAPPPPLADARTIVVDPSLEWQGRGVQEGESAGEAPGDGLSGQKVESTEPGSPPFPGRTVPPGSPRDRWTGRPLNRW